MYRCLLNRPLVQVQLYLSGLWLTRGYQGLQESRAHGPLHGWGCLSHAAFISKWPPMIEGLTCIVRAIRILDILDQGTKGHGLYVYIYIYVICINPIYRL